MTKQEKIRGGLITFLETDVDAIGAIIYHTEDALASRVLAYLHSQGVVILVEREQKYSEETGALIKPTKYKILQPLIEEEK